MDGNGAFNFHDDSVLKGYLLLKDDEYSRKISSSVSNPDLKDSEKYNYVLFAGSKEADALTVIANTVTNNNIVAANGVFLPSGKGNTSRVVLETIHTGRHTKEYIEYVNQRIEEIDMIITINKLSYKEAQQLICEELHKIRKDLLNGILKLNKRY